MLRFTRICIGSLMLQAARTMARGTFDGACVEGEGYHCSASPMKTAAALLQVKRDVASTAPGQHVKGGTTPTHDQTYTALESSGSQRFTKDIWKMTRPFAFTASGQHVKFVNASKNNQTHTAPEFPESQRVTEFIWKMIRPDAWNCNLLPPGDPREHTCALTSNDLGNLKPELLDCGRYDACSIEHANSFRTLQPVGALPCCPTPPFCSAPTCNQELVNTSSHACTNRAASENIEYLKAQNSFPAYHGYGGAFEVDIHKVFDVLSQILAPTLGQRWVLHGAFDVVLDLGANAGFYTEELTARRFAKNYILVEANPSFVNTLRARWGNETFKQRWFTQQVNLQASDPIPQFEIINQALSNATGAVLDLCQTEGSLAESEHGCNVPIATIDSLIPSALTPGFQELLRNAQSAFVKVDTEGMDELVLRGMKKLLQEQRGVNADGTPGYLVNFLQFEYAPALSRVAKDREGFQAYNLKTVVQFLESVGFETFLIGPRFLRLSHGSWDDEYVKFTEDPRNNMGRRETYPSFDKQIAPWCYDTDCATMDKPSFTSDVFAVRAVHPHAAAVKLALGACQESKDFDVNDPQYRHSL